MIEQFYKAFKDDIAQVHTLSIPQIQKFVTDWSDHVLEGQQLSEAEKLLSDLAENNAKFEQLLQDICLNITEQNLCLLVLLTLTLGLIVPVRLLTSEYLPYLIEQYYSNNYQSINLLMALFSEFHYRDITIHLPQITDPEMIVVAKQMKLTLYDKKYILILQNIQRYTHQKDQELLDAIIRQFNELKIYAMHTLHKILTQSIQKFIEYESQELAELYEDVELNQYYESIPPLKGITVIRAKEVLLQRKLFITNEIIHVPEDETIEYKEMANFESKNQFIVKKAVTALMNQQGGTLFIGIKDSLEVRGFNIGTNVFLFRNLLWEMCLDKIHPQLQLDKDIFVDILPLVNDDGSPIEGQAIIRIGLFRSPSNKNVYTFGELIEYHQSCEVTFCFKRYGDESKAVKHYHLKQLMKIFQYNNSASIFDGYGREFNFRCNNRRRYSSQSYKDRENLKSQVFYSKEFKFQSVENREQIYSENSIILEKNEEKDISQVIQNLNIVQNIQLKEEKDFDTWKQCIIFRKMNKIYYEKILNFIKDIKNQTQKIGDILPATPTIHVLLKGATKDEIIQLLIAQAAKNKDSLQFTCGFPYVLQVQLTKEDLYTKISSKLKLHNFSVEEKSECLNISATHLDDLILIYSYLRQREKLVVHWKLNEQVDVMIINGVQVKKGGQNKE